MSEIKKDAPKKPKVNAQEFEEWWEEKSGWAGEKLAEYQLAKAAWQAALSSRADCGEFKEWFVKQFNLPNYEEHSPMKEPCKAAFLAGQKSKAAKLKLPDEDTLMTWIRTKLDKDGYRPNEFETLNFIKKYAVKSMNEWGE